MVEIRRAGLATTAGLLLLALLPPVVIAQQRTLYPQAPYTRPGVVAGEDRERQPDLAGHQLAVNTAVLGRDRTPVHHYGTGYGGFGYGGYGYGGYGYPMSRTGSALAGYGQTLQGAASVASAMGGYHQDIEQAKMTRQQVQQMSIDTRRKQIEYEMWYEGVRPTAPKMIEKERQTDLQVAREGAPYSQITSGYTLNVLLQSVLRAGTPLAGPNISLELFTVNGLNLTPPRTQGSLALAKDEGRIEWTEALQDSSYDTIRDNFSKTFTAALKEAESGMPPDRATLNELRGGLKLIDDQLEGQVRDLPPSRYIESRRLLNKLKDTIRGLSDRRITSAASSGWRQSTRTVRDLVAYCQKQGLEFGPAMASGDDQAYNAAYFALRAYERGVVPQRSLATGSPGER